MEKIKLAIIGASYLQEPLIQKAKSRGIETHVFAWAAGDVGEKSADYFYPISITEKDEILEKCREIGVDGICTIASDLAAVTVGYVANGLGLIGNPMEAVNVSTNKHLMRQCFEKNGDPSPKSIQVISVNDLDGIALEYPIIVKPVDRSGSRGITKLETVDGLEEAIKRAIEQGFEKCALVEEFAVGQEYSVEYISWKGQHTFLALTKKYTTGAPDFIETGHIEPAPVSRDLLAKVQAVVSHALDSLGVQYGASHSEIKIAPNGDIKIIEIGARMGGDNIGAALVQLSTGYDFIDAVIDVALGNEPKSCKSKESCAGIRFVFTKNDLKCLDEIKRCNPEILIEEDVHDITDEKVVDSGSRFGYFMFAADDIKTIEKYMPEMGVE
ncbi:ATP-grasp domain-containing protein [Pseudobutyrivibrio sp. NOR37]|uniref:ATP-grasp domain-containing protein n=1 Tax=Pseudobutyrivibrio TaxID=46205 RepID=UPI0008E96535|nr:ATP-grasp domain-containing protein [Pseudobutyrivibrio sp. NOR37]SFR78094.1 ATP-grasp domain-containing protein [Pseudobutyrivibrio sp. NOR37]